MGNPTGKGGFKKGCSGNPDGRSKKRRDIEALAQEHTATAIQALADVAAQDGDLRAKVAAAVALLDRGYGKPTQTHAGDPERPLVKMIEIRMPANGRNNDDRRAATGPTVAVSSN